MTEKKRRLVDIDEIYKDKALAKSQNQLNVLLNSEPKKDWVKTHPLLNVQYLPIERIEYLLTAIFTEWGVEIKDIKLIANSVLVSIRLHYRNPITNTMQFQDGVGASPLQTDKKASATDWSKIKSSAVMMAAPAAESFAVKDAAEKIGKLFGKDLNRADAIAYSVLSKRFEEPVNIEDLINEVIELVDKLPKDSQKQYKDILKEKKKAGEISINLINEIKKKVEDEIS